MGRSPRLIPPLMSETPPDINSDNDKARAAQELISHLDHDVAEARDNLLAAKISQAEFANRHRNDEVVFVPGDRVLLSTEHQRREYMQAKSGHVAKLLPQFDGPFVVTAAHPKKSCYTLDLPNEPLQFATFHSSLLRPSLPNNPILYPSRQLAQPGPVITPDGSQEWTIDRILDERTRGRQYLIQWVGWGPEEDRWLPG